MSLRRSSRIAELVENKIKEVNVKKKKGEDGYTLSTTLSQQSRNLIAKNIEDEIKFPINSQDWIIFFCEYFDYIEKNIGVCLSKIPGLAHLKVSDLEKANLSSGGFDDEFNNSSKLNYNIGLYEELFKQFRDGTNKINNCARINLLLSYIGEAVLRIANRRNSTSAGDLIEFYRKLVVILELSVYPQIFLHYMTGDSTGQTHQIDFTYHDKSTHLWYIGIWLRKQEYLGVVSSNGKNSWKKYDSGLRLFIRNFLNRLITYMRTYNLNYPLGYELPYAYSADAKKRAINPLPFDGVYKYSAPPDNYYISKDDWDYIPNFLLPEDAAWTSFAKNFKHPSKWNNPPPQWWIDRTLELLNGFAWWKSGTDEEEYYKKQLSGTKNLAKWFALNCIIDKQYDSYEMTWEADNEDFEEAGMSYGGGLKKRTMYFKQKNKKSFKIIPDKDIALDPIIIKELKYKLNEYFKLNIVKSKDKKVEGHLRDNTFIDNLNNSIIYNVQNNEIKMTESKSLKKKVRVFTPNPSSSYASRAATV
jgi:hypothetical protein